jgi:hypothetical protein
MKGFLVMSDLAPIEYQGQRILTTQQLAEAYEVDEGRISENFNRNRDRYSLGKHHFVLEGEDLKKFGDQYANCVVVDRISKLYLWTKRGAFMHAKSLNTDKTWELYNHLVDFYFDHLDSLSSLQGNDPRLQEKIELLGSHIRVLQARWYHMQAVNSQIKEQKRIRQAEASPVALSTFQQRILNKIKDMGGVQVPRVDVHRELNITKSQDRGFIKATQTLIAKGLITADQVGRNVYYSLTSLSAVEQ